MGHNAELIKWLKLRLCGHPGIIQWFCFEKIRSEFEKTPYGWRVPLSNFKRTIKRMGFDINQIGVQVSAGSRYAGNFPGDKFLTKINK